MCRGRTPRCWRVMRCPRARPPPHPPAVGVPFSEDRLEEMLDVIEAQGFRMDANTLVRSVQPVCAPRVTPWLPGNGAESPAPLLLRGGPPPPPPLSEVQSGALDGAAGLQAWRACRGAARSGRGADAAQRDARTCTPVTFCSCHKWHSGQAGRIPLIVCTSARRAAQGYSKRERVGEAGGAAGARAPTAASTLLRVMRPRREVHALGGPPQRVGVLGLGGKHLALPRDGALELHVVRGQVGTCVGVPQPHQQIPRPVLLRGVVPFQDPNVACARIFAGGGQRAIVGGCIAAARSASACRAALRRPLRHPSPSPVSL